MADFFCSAVLCCALLYCTLLYCAVLCCPVLCVLSGRQTAISRPEIPISRQEKNGGQHEKTCRVRSQFSLCLTERTLTSPAAASCSRSVRRIALSAMPRGKVPSPIARIPEKLTSNGQAEWKIFIFQLCFGRRIFVFSVDNTKFRCHNRYVISKML